MNKNRPSSFESEWKERFDRFASRGGSSAKISGWSEHGLERRIEEILRVLESHGPAPASRILDLGCGSGVYCLHLRERGYSPVGADFSPGMLGRARAVLDAIEGPKEVPLVCADVLALPFRNEAFGGVINVGVLQHISDGATALREMTRVLEPKGRLYLITLNKVSLFGIVTHALATLKAWASGQLRAKKHAIRRRPTQLVRIGRAAGAERCTVRGLYLFPGPFKAFEGFVRSLEFLRWPWNGQPVVLFFANAFLLVLEKRESISD